MRNGPVRFLTIGQLAAAANVHIETIRYYQRIKLLTVPERPVGGIRRYSNATLSRLRFIRHAKELGFSLKDINALLQLDERDCDDVRKLAEHKLADVRKRIADLESMARTLSIMIRQCEASNRPTCPIIDSLTEPTKT